MELPQEPRLRFLLRAAARLWAGGAEPVSGLVLPTAEFFPDAFDRSPGALEGLLRRTSTLAGLSDLPLEIDVAGNGAPGGSCSTGGCCGAGAGTGPLRRVQARSEADGGYLVTVGANELGHPVLLTTALVRALSHVFLLEARLYREFDRAEREAVVDVAGTLLGFGVLLANGAYVYSKGCGGPRVATGTALPVAEVAVALAVFCALHRIAPRSARAHLDPTPRAYFDEASLWARSNAGIIGLLQRDPAVIVADSYALSEARGWLSRLLGIGRAPGPSVPTDDEIERLARSLERRRPTPSLDADRKRRREELRELVDEALDGHRRP